MYIQRTYCKMYTFHQNLGATRSMFHRQPKDYATQWRIQNMGKLAPAICAPLQNGVQYTEYLVYVPKRTSVNRGLYMFQSAPQSTELCMCSKTHLSQHSSVCVPKHTSVNTALYMFQSAPQSTEVCICSKAHLSQHSSVYVPKHTSVNTALYMFQSAPQSTQLCTCSKVHLSQHSSVYVPNRTSVNTALYMFQSAPQSTQLCICSNTHLSQNSSVYVPKSTSVNTALYMFQTYSSSHCSLQQQHSVTADFLWHLMSYNTLHPLYNCTSKHVHMLSKTLAFTAFISI
jgi:hypothetical protein